MINSIFTRDLALRTTRIVANHVRLVEELRAAGRPTDKVEEALEVVTDLLRLFESAAGQPTEEAEEALKAVRDLLRLFERDLVAADKECGTLRGKC